jgi:hypothetical protein
MAEVGRERAVLDNIVPEPVTLEVNAGVMAEDILPPEESLYQSPWVNHGGLNDWQPESLSFLFGSPNYSYSPEALFGFLDTVDDNGRQTMWTHNLEFGNKSEWYEATLPIRILTQLGTAWNWRWMTAIPCWTCTMPRPS